MSSATSTSNAVSAAFFCPQNRPPKTQYLSHVRRYLRGHPSLIPFVQAILNLPATWSMYANARDDLAALSQGLTYTAYFRDWISENDDASLARLMDTMSGIIALPLLTILQIVQYFQYLDARGISHNDFLHETKVGGLQGFCGGQLPVFAIASSSNEDEVVRNAVVCLRIALGIGAFGELGDDPNVEGPTTIALRLKRPEQAQEITTRFPSTYISAVTEPLSVSVVGPTLLLRQLKKHLEAEDVLVTELFLRGKVHNPENQELWQEMCSLIDTTPELQLPTGAALKVPVRVNSTGGIIEAETKLSHELTRSTLVARCEWYSVLQATAAALQSAPSQVVHTFAMFGTGNKNIVTNVPFEQKGLKISKQDVVKFVEEQTSGSVRGPELNSFSQEHSIAIVGAACRLPGADSLEDLWQNVLSKGAIKAQPVPVTRFDAARVPRNMQNVKEDRTWFGNFIDDVDCFDNSFFGISPREALNMDPQQRLLLEVSYQALDSSGYLRHHRREDFDKVGCFIGSTYTEYLENTTAYNPTAYTATGTIRAMQSGKISYHFGWSGPSEVIDTACSSSLVAVHRACRAIQAGECSMALAGGVNIITGIQNFLDLGKAGFLSHTGQCKPFDAAADGYCRADGVGLVVLKSLAQALANNDDILGVIRGAATNQGGLSSSITVPHDRAQVELFTSVLEQSGLKKEQISYCEAHGTGTQVGDPIEMSSIRHVFAANERPLLHVGSLKANVGHSESAAGIGSLMKVLTMLQHSAIPPLAGYKSLNPKIPDIAKDNIIIDTAIEQWSAPIKAAMVNSYGASGSNSAVICSEGPRVSRPYTSAKNNGLRYPVIISADDVESVEAVGTKLVDFLENANCHLEDIAYTLNERRRRHKICWAGLYKTKAELLENLKTVPVSHFHSPEGSKRKKVVLVFSGQSKQNIGLDASIYRWNPAFRDYILRCDTVLRLQGRSSFLPALFQSTIISDIVTLQCGTFAVQYASAMCWIDSGLRVQAVVGHSFGELTAMVVSGILSLADGLKLVATRADLMKTKWGTERGTMLAVHTECQVVHELVASVPGLEVACYNGPRSQVIVGNAASIEHANATIGNDARFSNKSIKVQLVNTSHGFHSVFTEPILSDMSDLARTLTFKPATIPLESCTMTECSMMSHERIVEHTRCPVYFGEAITRLEQRLGGCIFLEAGFGSPIIPMTKKAVGDAAKHAFIAGPKESEKAHDLASMTLSLWKEGIDATWWAQIPHPEMMGKATWLPPYQFRKPKHWLTYADYSQKALSPTEKITPVRSSPPQLVTARGRSRDSWASLTFDIHQSTRRFTDIVSGHAVRGQPLCPASMYLECAVMAAKMIEPGMKAAAIKCEDISFQGGLGLNPDREVVLGMDGAGEYLSWNFTVNSTSRQNKTTRPIVHAKGKLSITSADDWQLYSRVVADQANSLRSNANADKITANRAYVLFSRVVTYSSVMRGIQQVSMIGNQAVANVQKPVTAARGGSESTATGLCDAIALDTFIQVAGLLVNSSDTCPADEVYIATKIDSLSVQANDIANADQCVVYTRTKVVDDTRVSCDVFVLDKTENLIVTVAGVQFTRIPIMRLEKILTSAQINAASILETQSLPAVKVPHQHIDRDLDGTTVIDETTSKRLVKIADTFGLERLSRLGLDSLTTLRLTKQISEQEFALSADGQTKVLPVSIGHDSKNHGDDLQLRKRVIELIAENVGSSLTNIEDSVALQDIGIDSLSIVELKSSLEDVLGKQLGPDDMMLESTLREILELGARYTMNEATMKEQSAAAVHVSVPIVAY